MVVLDTDIMVDILRAYPPAVAWLNSLREESVVLPGYVAMELIQGCRNRLEQERVEKALVSRTLAWPSPQTCEQALQVFCTYCLSHNLGMLDALIAQTALAMNSPLCTFNVKHYDTIPGLQTVQPYERAALL